VDIANVLTRRYPGKLWGLVDNDYETLEWDDESPKPTLKQLEKLWPGVEAEMAKEYAKKARRRDYELTADSVFFQYQRGEATEQEWLDAVQAVKDAHPYPDEV
jgi:hypothetical protein